MISSDDIIVQALIAPIISRNMIVIFNSCCSHSKHISVIIDDRILSFKKIQHVEALKHGSYILIDVDFIHFYHARLFIVQLFVQSINHYFRKNFMWQLAIS